ncbi:unnamed protein product [Thelazia callipaeda]|uniref:non-specific serine/threonine protein kinase n=1 Tax=Thelazia callipaeda TaxID=103827 RepID=A0A0N5DC69_THECL|nr:unnamed protein product [Thelazia callipaeda]
MTRPVHSHNLPRKSTNFFSGNKSDWACEFPNTPLPVTNEKSASTNLVYSLPLDYQDFSVKNSYQQMLDSLANDSALHKEISLGKRVGFYKIGQQLGSGSFSKVKIGIHCLTNEMVAMKIVDKMKMDQKAQKLLAREITTMELLHHPNIIRFFECLQTISRTYLVMEYAGGGELYTYVHDKGKLQEDECKSLFAQIVSAVFHMHSKDIVHRDIKAENVIISKPGWVKLTDFGFACKVIPNKFLSTFCGSPAYAAPELFNKKKYFGKSVDIWAIGILLYFMLAGNTPFRGETIVDLTDCVLRGIYSLPDYLSTPAQLAISRMLVANPRDRSTIEEVKVNERLFLHLTSFHLYLASICA